MLPVSSSHLSRAGLMEKRENHDYLQQLKVEDRKNVDTEDQDKTDADERKHKLRMVVHIIQLNVSSCRIITPQQPPSHPSCQPWAVSNTLKLNHQNFLSYYLK